MRLIALKSYIPSAPKLSLSGSETKMTVKVFVLLILTVFASETNENEENDRKYGEKNGNSAENSIIVKIEEDEYAKVNVTKTFLKIGKIHLSYCP